MKEPDKLRTIKCSFESILNNNKKKYIQKKLFDATCRTHEIITHTYQLIRLWILYKYKKNIDIPLITEDVIKMTFKTLIQDSCGPKLKGNNLIIYEELKKFYNKKYSKLLVNKDKINGSNLSQILRYSATDIITNIENNIKLNFISYVKRFVNSSFKKINNQLLENSKIFRFTPYFSDSNYTLVPLVPVNMELKLN